MSSQTTFRAGLVQMRSGRDIAANLEAVSDLIREAAGEGAQYVQTPENTLIMELSRERLFSDDVHDRTANAIASLCTLANELDIWLHIGATPQRRDENSMANRSTLIGPDGAIAARYDKIHMFDADLDGGESYRESGTYNSGDQAVVADLPWGRLGMTICYDIRFPALYRALAQKGADFISVPSAFTLQTGEVHWHVLLRARAIETGCFIFASGQGGLHEIGRNTYGHSLIVSPWGAVIAEASGTKSCVILADINVDDVAAARARVPSLRHDRPFAT